MRVLSVLCTFCCLAPAQTLLKDINTAPSKAGSTQFFASLTVGGATLLVADDGAHGRELYVADASGVRLVADVNPGPKGFVPTPLAEFGAFGYLDVRDGPKPGLWRSDGTAAGTTFVHQVRATSAAVWQGALWLLVPTGIGGPQLWRSDGTAAGTQLATQIVTQQTYAQGPLRALGNRLVFSLNFDLWSSDGTAAGTQVLSKQGDSVGGPFVGLGTELFFTLQNVTAGRELWKTDGTPAGTVMVVDLNPGFTASDPQSLVTLGGKLYFSAHNSATRRLFVTDGTAAGTVALGGQEVGSEIVTTAGALFFTASDPTHGLEPWTSDGTAAGTRMVKDVATTGTTGSAPAGWVAAGNLAFFGADDGSSGREPYVTDGTAGGTRLLKDLRPGSASSLSTTATGRITFANGNVAYFTADDGVFGQELWRSDGTAPGTVLAADLNGHLTADAAITEIVAGDGVAYFVATDAQGPAIWRTDGTPAGTRVAIRNFGFRVTTITQLRMVGSRLFFRAHEGFPFDRIFASDGTEAGTVQITPGNGTGRLVLLGNTDLIVAFAGRVWFQWGDTTIGQELWTSDGTVAGTGPFLDLEPGFPSSYPNSLCVVGTTLYFCTLAVPNPGKLWRTDGTVAGTRIVTTLPGPLMIYPRAFAGLLLFASDGLDRTDGTAAGTFQLDGTIPSETVEWRGAVYYAKSIGSVEGQLWRTDGTVAGTRIVRAFPPVGFGTRIGALAATPGALLLAVDSGGSGYELWASDGTAAGTWQVKDIAPGPDQGIKGSIASVAANPRALVQGVDPLLGGELFVTDGTTQGTRLLADLNPGPGSSAPGVFTRLGSKVLFVADDGVHGSELWSLDLRAVDGALADPIGEPCGARITSAGAPVLGTFGFWAGIEAAPATAPLLWLLGASRQDLPLLGCTLHVGGPIFAVGGTTDATGSAVLPVVVPNDPRLLGGELWMQAAVANGAGLALSDALYLLVGR